MSDIYIDWIVVLLPLTALMLVRSQNPYHALVIRGIMGAIAALVYSVLGAADVALTEALVGTMLAITLYAVAVRSSLVLRLGVQASEFQGSTCDRRWGQLWQELRPLLDRYHLRLELVTYDDPKALHQSLANEEVHAIAQTVNQANEANKPFIMTTRIQRIYELMETDLTLTDNQLFTATPEISMTSEPVTYGGSSR
ncbi:DUF4040 domain-containing protein [Sodalinema gerasimenkoae]|uniref:DUF4040 domain-containing protein n=1 Tax=Sodalinema gerasimenkoae TaxID=2862348 RepID=UPI00135BFBEA|nr:DUF4040 domain-containing protein [Sodalinema gerasimenkoae]